MKKVLFAVFLFFVIFAISCGSSSSNSGSNGSSGSGGSMDSGEITLILPIDDGFCLDYDEDEDYINDYTYCINPDDQISVSIYARESQNEEWTFAFEKMFKVSQAGQDSVSFPFKLDKKHHYLRFFAKVLDKNKQIKLTGGVDNATQSNPKIFLAPAGDFVRVTSDRKDENNSLKSYFDDDGSKGAAAVALKDGRIYMSGGYDFGNDEILKKAVIFDMQSLSKKEVKNLPARLYDHIAALLDDGSESGKVIVGFGMTEEELNYSVWVYDPKSDKYEPLALGAPAVTKAKAITINGDVYIIGGCSYSYRGEANVYKISAKTGSVVGELFATLKQGRCNHALADVSTSNEVRILVIGGSTDAREGKETPVTGENFAELVTLGSSAPMAVTDRNGGDDAELKAKGLISPAAAAIVIDDKEPAEKVVSVTGGYIRSGDDEDALWITSPYMFVFSEKDGELIYDKNTSPFECARPSMAALGKWKNDFYAYAAVNCGTKWIERTAKNASEQTIFVIQVKRVKNSDLGIEVFSSSVKDSLMDENHDPYSDASILDGPVAVDALGQVFMLGGKYVYMTGSYAVPGTEYSDAPKDLPPKPIIHVDFEYPIIPPMSYRNIYDKVQMNLKDTCVSDPDASEQCLENWVEKYYIKYKWEMTESPTPLLEESKLKLTDMDASAGQWLADTGNRDNPKRAAFTGLMITPRRYPGETNPAYNAEKCTSECGEGPVYNANNPDKFFFKTFSDYLICRQKYCEETKTKYYKINIQAETVDRATGATSETADITVVPKIIPPARVAIQLSWKQGFKTREDMDHKEGVATDLNIHLVKKTSLEAPQYGFEHIEGLLGTVRRSTAIDCPVTLPECEQFWRHDDCSYGDSGQISEDIPRDGTIQWHASLDIDNTWGGGNYESPETIGLGPIDDMDGDGIPDLLIMDDQYLVVVNYGSCMSKYADQEDRCDPSYTGEDGAYEVDARVNILIDGDEAPREAASDRPADSYNQDTMDFKIKLNEWKVIAVIKWDNSLENSSTYPGWTGSAVVSDKKMEDQGIETDPLSYPVCTYDMAEAILIPIWDAEEYKNHITTPNDLDMRIGTCN